MQDIARWFKSGFLHRRDSSSIFFLILGATHSMSLWLGLCALGVHVCPDVLYSLFLCCEAIFWKMSFKVFCDIEMYFNNKLIDIFKTCAYMLINNVNFLAGHLCYKSTCLNEIKRLLTLKHLYLKVISPKHYFSELLYGLFQFHCIWLFLFFWSCW